MTNTLPQGSTGAPSLSYPSSSTGIMPRRSSYASVAAGTATALHSASTPSVRSGAFSDLITPNPASPTYIHTRNSDSSSRVSQHSLDADLRTTAGNSIPGNWGRGNMTSFSSHHFPGDGYGLTGGGALGTHGFFKPTYLRESKYVERLEAAHKAKLAAQKEASSTHSNQGTLSTSSSSVSLHKLAPSHRGMTYDIIEHQQPADDDGLTPLPSRWAEADRFGGLEIAADGLDVRYTTTSKLHDHEAAATRADHPMPPQCGIYYYEVTVVSKGKEGMIGIGFSRPKASLEKLPGWEPDSWAYHGDDGMSFCGQSTGKSYGPTFTTSDIVGCGVNFMTGCAFFTKNGVFQGNAFRDLKDINIYPSIGMKRPGAHLSVNFGQRPFVFDIDAMMAREKSTISDEINSIDVSKLQPPLDEVNLLKKLVAQFLAHDGYVETAKAFGEEVLSESNSLNRGSVTSIDTLRAEDDLDAVNRQQIRAAILDGDIDKALKRTNAYYPHVLQDNPHIYFRLRCRKFIEMTRQCTELLKGSSDNRAKPINGHSILASDDDYEPDMDVDEQLNNGDDWDKMETEEADGSMKYHCLLENILTYGQELQNEFKEERSKDVKDALTDIFAMLAYEDARTSPQAHLLDRSGRVLVAEELNSAILVSLGKSSSAAIERLYQQTEVLVSDISEEGGAGAFINVRDDFLR